LSIFPFSFFLLHSFSRERKKLLLVRKEEGKMKKEEETPDFTGVSLCTLFRLTWWSVVGSRWSVVVTG
jgi:hypothetical protein